MAIVITVMIEKGGVGKTTTAVNLATAMALDKKKVLVVDMDGQANATFSLTGENKLSDAFSGKSVSDMLCVVGSNAPLDGYLIKTTVPCVDLIASTKQTHEVPNLIASLSKIKHIKPAHFLAAALSAFAERYDYIIIDTPPAMDMLTKAAMFTSDYVLLPMKCDSYCLDSLATTFGAIKEVEKEEDTQIRLLGIVLTMVERTAGVKYIRDILQTGDYKDDLLKTEIRKSAAVVDSSILAAPVIVTAKNSNPAKDYIALYEELKRKIRRMEKEDAQ